jgi:hypothetical protein
MNPRRGTAARGAREQDAAGTGYCGGEALRLGFRGGRPDADPPIAVRLGHTGTVLVHRLANLESYRRVKDALGAVPVSQRDYEMDYPIALRLPEHLAIFRRYIDPGVKSMAVGMVKVLQVV